MVGIGSYPWVLSSTGSGEVVLDLGSMMAAEDYECVSDFMADAAVEDVTVVDFSEYDLHEVEQRLIDDQPKRARLLGGITRGISLNTRLRRLSLCDVTVKAPLVRMLLQDMRMNSTLTELDLSGNQSVDECAGELGEMLANNGHLKKLCVGYHQTVNLPGTLGRMCMNLETNDALEELVIKGYEGSYHPSNADVVALRKALERNRGLKNLILQQFCCSNASQHVLDVIFMGLKANDTMERLVVDGNWMGYEGGIELADVLACNTSLKKLSIGGCHVRQYGINILPNIPIALFRSLQTNNTLEELLMHGNRLVDGAAEALGRALACNTGLKVLDLSTCGINDAGFRFIASGLEKNSVLEKLEMRDNHDLANTSALVLGRALGSNSSLKTLALSNCDIGAVGAEAVFEGLQNHCCALTKLSISYNNIGDAGAEALGHALAYNTSLRAITMEKCGIESAGMMAIANGLKKNSTLEELYIGNNPWGLVYSSSSASSAEALGDALLRNAGLKILGLHSTFRDPRLPAAVFRGLKYNSALVELKMMHNDLIDTTGSGSRECASEALGEMLACNTHLKVLDLEGCANETVSFRAIFHGLMMNTSLEMLDIRGDMVGIGQEGAWALGEALVKNTSLKKLYVKILHEDLYSEAREAMGDTGQGPKGTRHFLKCFKTNTTLEKLSVDWMDFAWSRHLPLFREAMTFITGLTTLEVRGMLGYHEIAEWTQALGDAMGSNDALIDFEIMSDCQDSYEIWQAIRVAAHLARLRSKFAAFAMGMHPRLGVCGTEAADEDEIRRFPLQGNDDAFNLVGQAYCDKYVRPWSGWS